MPSSANSPLVVWLEHSASIIIIFTGQQKMVSVYRQSMYEACLLSKFPTSIIFNNPFILWWEVLTAIEVTCNRW